MNDDLNKWERETEHTQKALDHRAGPFQTPATAYILTPITEQMQEVEDMLWGIFDARFVANATGDALEILGAIVGEAPLDDTEQTFKLRISLKLRAILSTKKRNDFVQLLLLLENSTWKITESPGWAIVIQQTGSSAVSSAALQRMLDICSADGVLVRQENYEDGDTFFVWPSQDGSILGGEWSSQDGTIEGNDWPGVTTT